MSNIAIEFQNVGKMYGLGRVDTDTLSHDLNRWWQMIVLGKEDPYLKIGQTNDRTTKGESDYVWVLRDISFKVEQGEVLGIIGKLPERVTNGNNGSIMGMTKHEITRKFDEIVDFSGVEHYLDTPDKRY